MKKLVFLIISAGLLASTPVSGMKRAKTTAAKHKAVKKETKGAQEETQEQKEEKAALILQKYIRTYLAKKKAAAEWVKGLAHQLVDGFLDPNLPKEMIISKLKSAPKTLRPFIADELLNLINLKGLISNKLLHDIIALLLSVYNNNDILNTLNKELLVGTIDQELINELKQAPEIERKIKKLITYIISRTNQQEEEFLDLLNDLKTTCEHIAAHCSGPISKSFFSKASNIFNIISSTEQLGIPLDSEFALRLVCNFIDGLGRGIKSEIASYVQNQKEELEYAREENPFDLFFNQPPHTNPIATTAPSSYTVAPVVQATTSDQDSGTEQ